jgi:small subunit ribosomal protein S16
MVKIRLSRKGVRNKPFYRIVAINEKEKAAGNPLEILGYWHPRKNTKKLYSDKIKAWQAKGAKLTKAVEQLLQK